MKILTVVGARPQFIKASVVSRVIKRDSNIDEVIIHTGQHFDSDMSDVFFTQLNIPVPHYRLDIHGGSHGAMTGRMLMEIERILLRERPDCLMVYGDTTSTLAGALAAAKQNVPVAHVEAGLRSFNMRMPEEVNRILTDQISSRLFCPTEMAVDNLRAEGFERRSEVQIARVGDVMEDAAKLFAPRAARPAEVTWSGEFILATFHRAENTDDIKRLRNIVDALNVVHEEMAKVVLPIHPRTRQAIVQAGLSLNVEVIEPVGYLEMIWLLQHCKLVMTDSGGLQKEAFFFRQPCVTMRDETEWTELIDINANVLAGADSERIFRAARRQYGRDVKDVDNLYGGGFAAERIISLLSTPDTSLLTRNT